MFFLRYYMIFLLISCPPLKKVRSNLEMLFFKLTNCAEELYKLQHYEVWIVEIGKL